MAAEILEGNKPLTDTRNHINILQIRETFDDEDDLQITAWPAGPHPDTVETWTATYVTGDHQGEEPVQVINNEDIVDGQTLTTNGRSFQIRIQEVDVCLAGAPALDGKCGDPECVCSSPENSPENTWAAANPAVYHAAVAARDHLRLAFAAMLEPHDTAEGSSVLEALQNAHSSTNDAINEYLEDN